MTKQEKIKWLSQYRDVVKETMRLVREKEEWRSLAEKMTPSYSFEPKTQSVASKVETGAENIVEIDKQLQDQIAKRVRLRLEIAKVIYDLGSEKHRYLLSSRYIDGKKWEQIALDMNYSVMQIWRMHGEALNLINM